MNALDWVAVAVLGGFAAIARFLLDGLISRRYSELPLGTFVINVSGSFILGVLAGAAVTGTAETLAGTATIGTYTTFSTWILETHRLREDGELAWAGANIVFSLVVGFAGVLLGHFVGVHG
jgi:fluoride exporter